MGKRKNGKRKYKTKHTLLRNTDYKIQYVRRGIFSPDIIFKNITTHKNRNKDVIFNGRIVNMFSLRYKTFLRSGLTCHYCGLTASYFALEKFNNKQQRDSKRFHFNLYGVDSKSGKEILFTKDHIKPKSKGGSNQLSNLQTLCVNCNNKKDDRY